MKIRKIRGTGFGRTGQLALLVGMVMVSCGQSEPQQAGADGAPEPVQVAQAQPGASPARTASGSGDKPNILMIMSDDVGISNISAYSEGLVGYCCPPLKLDRFQ